MLLLALFIIILIWAALSQSRRLDRVEERLGIVEIQLQRQENPAPVRVHAPISVPQPEPAPQPVAPAPMPAPEPPPIAILHREPEPEPEPEREPAPLPEAPAIGWEERIGGNLLNKLGALILVIGVALFLRYSFGNMGPGGRAFSALTLSGVLLGSGALVEQKERYRNFSRGLMAAGWAGLYFTTYAMYDLPATRIIENPAIGTLLMTGVAIGMVVHSLRYRVQSLTALSFGCIYAALALSTMNTFVAAALIPLAVAMLYLARRFEWHATAVFSAACTYAVFLTRPASGASLAAIQTMLVIFWTTFEAFDLIRLRSRQAATEWSRVLFGLNAAAGLASSAALWYRMAPDSMWIFCTGAATLYLASTWLRYASDGETYYEFSLAISALLAALAIVAGVPGLWISLGLILEAEVLYLAGHRLRIPIAKILGGAGFAFALRYIADDFVQAEAFVPGIGLVHAGSPALAVLAAVCYLNRYLSREEPFWSYAGSAMIAFLCGVETKTQDLVGPVWLAFSAILFELGLRKSLPEFRIQAYLLAPFSAAATLALLPDEGGNWRLMVLGAFAYANAWRAIPETSTLEPWERSMLRRAGSSALTLSTAILIHRIALPGYEALTLLIASTVLLELGLRNLPSELRLPSAVMNVVGLGSLLVTHVADVQKHPAPETLISFGGAALLYYFFTARLLRSSNPNAIPARAITTTLGSVLTLATLWMIVPEGAMPFAMMPSASSPWKPASRATRTISSGMPAR